MPLPLIVLWLGVSRRLNFFSRRHKYFSKFTRAFCDTGTGAEKDGGQELHLHVPWSWGLFSLNRLAADRLHPEALILAHFAMGGAV
jgi:hypothetical protein